MLRALDRAPRVAARVGLAVAALALAAGGWAAAPERRLTLVDACGRTLLQSADGLTIRYLHSVARTPVEEDFVAVGSGVRVAATRFSSFGAGLPAQPEWGGTFRAPPGQPFQVDQMRDTLPSVTFRVGYVSQQTAILDGRAVRLDHLAPPGSAVTLLTEARPRWQWLLSPARPALQSGERAPRADASPADLALGCSAP